MRLNNNSLHLKGDISEEYQVKNITKKHRKLDFIIN